MAPSVKQPPDRPDRRFYKCHPTKQVSTVICIVCESAYHRSDFEKIKNHIYVGENLVICPEHSCKDITSNNEDHMLNDVARNVIAAIKLKQTEEIRKELLQELQNKTIEKHNTEIDEDSSSDGDIDILIAENNLLKKLVEELQDKNNVQKELIEFQRQKYSETQPIKKTYAEVMSNIKPRQKRVPKITVKTTDSNQKNTMELITSCLVKEQNIQTKFIRKKNDSELEISCMDAKSVEAAESAISSKVENIELKVEQQGNPKIKIVGIENLTKMKAHQLELDINNRNFSDFNHGGKVLYTFTNNRNKTETVLMEVTSEIYKYIRENGNRIFVGHQCCRTYDLINTTPCYNCARYGHSASKCKNESVCVKCSEEHNVNECKNNKIECANCTFNNTNHRTNLPTDHLSTDRIKCSILKKKVKKYIDSIDYPIAPVLPIWDETSALSALSKMRTNTLLYQRKVKTVKGLVSILDTNATAQQSANTQPSTSDPTTSISK